MSKKMSMLDMKEVKRLIGVLITNEFKGVKFIRGSHYRNMAISFSTNISSSNLVNSMEDLVDKHKLTKEISDLEQKLFNKQTELVKALSSAKKEDLESELENDGSKSHDHYRWRSESETETDYFDEFKAIRQAASAIVKIRYNKLEKRIQTFTSKVNNYINETESKVFDAYTKGMTADDFLTIVREEVKAFHAERDEISKELEENGYIDTVN